jgi:hypothetical protein
MEEYGGTMKINSSARYLVRIRVILVCAALAAIVGLDLFLVESLASRIGHTTARQPDSSAAPNVSISDLMAAVR